MVNKKLIAVFVLLLLSNCMKRIHYFPDTSSISRVKAKEIVKQVVLEQPGELAPIKVEVTDLFVKMYATKSNQADGYTIPWNTVIHFNNIGEIRLGMVKKWSKKWYVIAIMDKNSKEKYAVYTAHEIKAKAFIDALSALKIKRMGDNAIHFR